MKVAVTGAVAAGAAAGIAVPVAAARVTADQLLPSTGQGADATFRDFAAVGTGALVAGVAVAGAGVLALKGSSAAARALGHGAATAGLGVGATTFTGCLFVGSVWEWALANAAH